MPKVSSAHRAKRRRQILDGARKAFSRHGYEGATVPRLEKAIGLSRGAIFSYFPSKWDLFYALAEEDQARAGEIWLEEGFGGVLRHIAKERPEWIGVYFELTGMLRTRPELREQFLKRSPEVNARLVERVRAMQRTAELRDDLDAEQLGRFMGIVLDGIVVAVAAGAPVDIDPVIRLVSAAIAPQ
jgi:TetR/AcrR family transcriptional regulator, transcriptional repressor of aconitase